MPKIIENVREQLLAEAKRQIAQNGYRETTIRSVASACGLGVGTVYNYFSSKDMLIASFMIEEWRECLLKMKQKSTSDIEAFLQNVYLSLQEFIEIHASLFRDEDAAKVFAVAFAERHKLLRNQLAEILMPICTHTNRKFLSEFIAESLLTWTMAGKSFEEIYSVIKLLLF
ncbi:MAG: TetR/AcrR family transcriptional regulator [Clostridia bacterium]|nr:TetR/AcrR family transcriptional regulator [Clostridia bacterium]